MWRSATWSPSTCVTPGCSIARVLCHRTTQTCPRRFGRDECRASQVAQGRERPGPRDIPEQVPFFAALSADRQRLLMHVNELVDEIKYGTVVVVLQDGKVVQIEMAEKFRLR